MLTLLVAIVAAIYFYRDAKRRGEPAMKSALIVFFSYIGAFVLLWIVTISFQIRFGPVGTIVTELVSIGFVSYYAFMKSKESSA